MSDSWPALALALLACLVLLGIVIALVLAGPSRRAHGAVRPHRSSFRRSREPERVRRAAIVINPTKFDDVAAITAELTAASTRLGWAEPLVLETTIEDPGTGQARQALEAGVDLVCPLGGDGTIRAVAVALSHTRTPMGLLPRGTGNLLARNLDVPVSDLDEAFTVAHTGRNRSIDVAWVELDPPVEASAKTSDETSVVAAVVAAAEDEGGSSAEPERHPFLVMAGMGFDAAIMSGTSESLKDRLGWMAYFVTGFRTLLIRRFGLDLVVDGVVREQQQARTVVFGNCGTLTGGIQLMPSAVLDDGRLEAVTISPKSLLGWTGIAARVLRRSEAETTQLTRATGESFTVEASTAQLVQVDGDVIGEATRLAVTVDRQALKVRVAPR